MAWSGTHDSAALSQKLRTLLEGRRGLSEKRMFGGTCFLLRDNMLCGAGKNGYLFRVGKEQDSAAGRLKGGEPVVMRGRAMAGFYWVEPSACTPRMLRAWLALAEAYVSKLPPKKKRTQKRTRSPAKHGERAQR